MESVGVVRACPPRVSHGRAPRLRGAASPRADAIHHRAPRCVESVPHPFVHRARAQGIAVASVGPDHVAVVVLEVVHAPVRERL